MERLVPGQEVVVEQRDEKSGCWDLIARGKLDRVTGKGTVFIKGDFGTAFIFEKSPNIRVTPRLLR